MSFGDTNMGRLCHFRRDFFVESERPILKKQISGLVEGIIPEALPPVQNAVMTRKWHFQVGSERCVQVFKISSPTTGLVPGVLMPFNWERGVSCRVSRAHFRPALFPELRGE